MAPPAESARAARVLDLFGGALDLPPEERAVFLRRECGEDSTLRAEIDSLLGYEDPATAFLERPAFILGPDLLSDAAGELRAGDVLGDCRIESLLGEGGMGEVYLAEDTALGRQVAVKLLKAHLSDEASGRRFRHERRVLGGLTHPGIARLYGAAVTSRGRSYLVMEYVEGERLDHYCDPRRLGLPARLSLFRQVCAAVSYAHQNLVIHRDLKPANIRVTPAGEPKLLDFGIAKLLEPDSTIGHGQTLTLGDAMTPEYASPEQIMGEPITTASDVYSLGVILYELLCGQRPYQLKGRRHEEIARTVCENPFRRPSAAAPEKLRRPLAGDLDNIVAKAMRREPARRYASVAQFSEDIRRHCDGLPVQARPDTLPYRAGKFVRRNKAGVAAAVLVVLALVAGLITTTLEARRANRRFEDVRRLAGSILFELEPQIANLPGSTQARSTLVRRALEYLDGLSREAGGNRGLRRELAAAYQKVGDVQGNPTSSNLGDIKGALVSYRKAQDLLQSLVRSDPRDEQAQDALAGNYEGLANVFWWSNQTAGAQTNFQRALDLRRALLAAQPRSAAHRRGYASVEMCLADVASWSNQPAEAQAHLRRALPVLQSLADADPRDAPAQVALASGFSRLAISQKEAGDYAAAEETFARAARLVDPLVQQDPNNHTARVEQWFVAFSEYEELSDRRAFDRAVPMAARAVELGEVLARQDPRDTKIQHDLAVSCICYGESLLETGRWQDAIAQLQRALDVDGALAARSPENGEYNHSCGTIHLSLGRARLHLDQLDAADTDEQTAQSLLEAAATGDPANPVPRRELVNVLMARGEICQRRQQGEQARAWFLRAQGELTALTDKKKYTTPADAWDRAEMQAGLAGAP